jgi:D-sedoheptulose 7-phosphate isomerase
MLKKDVKEAIIIKRQILLLDTKIKEVVEIISKKILLGGKILLCGNGGSAADAQHLAAEFLVRLRPGINRQGIPAISLATDISTITACANDFDFSKIFSRTFESLAKQNDVLIAISTTGQSKNILDVLKLSKKKRIFSLGLLGCNGGLAKKYCDFNLIINSKKTARIQEGHIFIGHYIAGQIENFLIKNKFI